MFEVIESLPSSYRERDRAQNCEIIFYLLHNAAFGFAFSFEACALDF